VSPTDPFELSSEHEGLRATVERFARTEVAGSGVGHAVGVEREQRVDVVGRLDAAGRQPAQLAGVAADLVGAVHPKADQLEVGAIDDRPEGKLADVAGAPLDDPMTHLARVSHGRAG